MSKFHNSIGGEKVALLHHLLGAMAGMLMFGMDLQIAQFAAAAHAVPDSLSLLTPLVVQLLRWMFFGGVGCAVYHAFMFAWHVNATLDHLGHMRELELYKGET